MLHNAKRSVSFLLAVLMCISMLTAVVLPVAAETATPADAYAKITGTVDGDVIIPDTNVYFYDSTAFASAPAGVANGDQFDYTYGDGAVWGDGKTYRLTWGVNTLSKMDQFRSTVKAYNTAWAANTSSKSQDLVVVFAPGGFPYMNDFELKAAGDAADPTPEELQNLYLLGPQAGKSPVNSKKDTKADAIKIMNDRSADKASELVLTSTFYVPSNTNFYMDGIAISEGARLYSGYDQTNHYYSNLYFGGMTNPAAHSIFGGGGYYKQNTFVFKNCYMDLSDEMTRTDLTSESNAIYGNKITFEDCVFYGGKLSKSAANCYYQTHHFQLYTTKSTSASENFYGEKLAVSPEISVTDCVGADWESAHLLRFPIQNENSYGSYKDHQATVTVKNNKFWDVGITSKSGSDIIFIDKVTTAAQASATHVEVTDNLFEFSKEVFAQGTTSNAMVFNFRNCALKEGTTNIANKYSFVIKDNIFRLVNDKKNSPFTGLDANTAPFDVSGNLFVDHDGNILPVMMHGYSVNGYSYAAIAQSDIYASDEMNGGVRELMTVHEVENGAALYSFIQMVVRGNLRNYTYFTGGLTLLLKRGVTYNANTLVKFKDPDVKFLGIYTEEACTNKVDTITQDTINGKYAKAQYKAGNTTLTVVYALNTPRNYWIVDPTGEYKTNGYTFNGVTYQEGQRATDGVYAKFFQYFDNGAGNDKSAYAQVSNPTINDLLALGTQTWQDKDGVKYTYNNNLNDLIVFTPGVHEFAGANKQQYMGKSVAMVGPQFAVSPYGAEAKEGKLANGRSTDPTKEAVIKGAIAPSGDSSLSYVIDGVTFAGTTDAWRTSQASALSGSMYQTHVVKNCIFANSAKTIIGGWDNTYQNKVIDLTIKDCVFDATGIDRDANDSLILTRSNLFTLENVAVLNDNTGKIAGTSHRFVYLLTTDGSKVKWNSKRPNAFINNIVLYNSNRDMFLYTLREASSANANFDYYPDGLDVIISNAYINGGLGYMWGIQNGESSGDAEIVNLTVTDNYFYRPDYKANVIGHYQADTKYGTGDAYSDASVAEGNVFVTNSVFKANAYEGDLNLDKNFFGKVEGGKIVATYVDPGYAAGVVKNTKEYWLDPEMTLKNTDLGIANDGYKAFELGDFLGYNQYTIDATNKTATPAMLGVANGTIAGVYSDAACTAVVTAFTHPQTVYVKVVYGEITLVNKVDLDCACSHDGTTTEKVLKEATCLETGIKANICDYCGEQVGADIVIPTTGIHTPGTLVTDVASTCKTAGYGHIPCSVCGETVEDNIALPLNPDNHIWNTEYTIIEDPTCTVPGNKEIQCSECAATKPGSNVLIEEIPHDWNTEYTIDKEPTCQEDGSKSIRCSVCGLQQDESEVIIPKGQHVWDTKYSVLIEATCEEYGYEVIRCTLCDSYQEDTGRRTPKADHIWNTEYTVDIEPTCTEEGVQSIYCSVCNVQKENSAVAVPTTPHNWDTEITIDKMPTCDEPGEESRWCLDCGEARTDVTVLPAEHGAGEIKTTLPTYAADGKISTVCEVCGVELSSTKLDKLVGADLTTLFDDVEADDWFYTNEAVRFVYDKGLMYGTDADSFSPNAPMTRGMFVTVLGRLYGVDVADYKGQAVAFKDVSAKAYYTPYILWAYENHIINGYSATTFGPDDNITREQICKIMLDYCNVDGVEVEKVNEVIVFADSANISKWARKYVTTCQQAGLVTGEKRSGDYFFRPKDTATRAEVATIIRNFVYTVSAY